MEATDHILQNMTERIVQTFDPIRVVLFGSRARGDEHAGSDLDLLVVLPKVENKREAAIAIRRLLRDVPIAKDIIVTSPQEIARRGNLVGSVLRPALREGRVLYERG
ncbi:MAG: nucleotidyltransferase domain-containing protein [Rhodothermales bacterium]